MHHGLIQSLQVVFGVMPFLSTLAWAFLFRFQGRGAPHPWRWTLALSCTVLGAFVLVLTELLSAVHGLKAATAVTAWSLYLLIPLILLTARRCLINLRAEAEGILNKLQQVPLWMLGVILLLGGIMLLMAVASPPMNFDVQCYHLPRQLFWLMQGSVQPFAATFSYQNSQPVLTEYLGLNLMLLSDGDAWHNLVQWMYFVAACGLVTLMTQSIGGNGRAQALAVIFIALVPVAFFEASNSKNDIAVSFFILMPLFVGLKIWMKEWAPSVPMLLLAALTAGLALATKGTAIAYLPPIAILIITGCIRRGGGARVLLLTLIPGVLISALPLAPVATRNLKSYHSAGGETSGLLNASHTPKSILGVVIKDIANQYAFGSNTSIVSLETGVRKLLNTIGVNPDDPETTIACDQLGGNALRFFYFVGCEDIIPAPVQMTLCLLIPFFLLIPAFRSKSGMVALSSVVFGAFLLFCVIFRWQPWGGRLLIPFFCMAAPLVGTAGAVLFHQWVPLAVTFLGILFLQPHMLFHGQRHIFGWQSVFRLSKEEQMCIPMPERKEEIRSIIKCLKSDQVHRILFDGKVSPMYGLLRQIRIELPQVEIISGSASKLSDEDALIESINSPEDPVLNVLTGYQLVWKGRFYRVYLKDPESRVLKTTKA